MAEENANTPVEKPTSIDKPKITINPITGLPFGGATINPETNTIDKNPITGKRFGLGLVDDKGKANYGSYNPSFPTLGGKGFSPSNVWTDTYTLYNQEPMEDYKKYGVPMGRHFDWNELRARNQSAGETILHGIGKSLVTFGGALLEDTIGFFAGLAEMASGGSYYDNAIGKTVDKWNAWADEAMPVYITKEEQDYSTWQKMGTAHFWADDVLGGMAYTAAAGAALYLTGGGGLLTKGAKVATTAALSRVALWNTSKAVINGTNLTKQIAKGAQFTNRLWNAAAVLEAGAMMSLAEASVEARETQKTTYNTLIENYLQEHKTTDIDNIPKDILKEFEETSYNAGNTNFVMQLPVLMGGNLLMFGRSVSGFKVGSAINKDVVWSTATEAYVNKLANKGFMSSTLSRLRPVALQGMNEAFQESFQFGSSAFASTYHIDKLNNNGNGDISKALAAGWDAMGTQEGIESALIGFITGGFFGGARSITSKQYSNRVERADRLAGLLNGGEMLNSAAMYQSSNAVSAASERMEMHLQNGNIKGYQDERFNLIAAQSLEMLERGGLELYIEQLEESSTLPEAEFKKLYHYLETDKHGDPISVEKQSNGKNQHEIINGMVKKLKQFQQTYNDVNDKFSLPDRTTGLPRLLMSEERRTAEDKVYNDTANLRNELILSAAGVRDRNRRMSNIQNNIQNTVDDIYLYNRDARGETISMTEVLSEQQPEHEGVQKWKEPTFRDKQDALVGDVVGIDEQGNPIYAPGTGEVVQPNRYDPNQQLIDTIAKLKIVENKIRQTDPLAADKIAELNKDYVELLADNNYSIDRYNKLSSDKFAQEQWTNALNKALAEKQQKNIDEDAIKVATEAKTAKEIRDNIDPSISPEVQQQVKERFEQLKKDENDAYKKYYNQVATLGSAEEQLKVLKDIDTDTLNDSEKEGLKKAINTITQRLQTEKMKNQSDEVTEEDVEVKETKKEIEEELAPENTGGVESISEDGRVFQIEGTQYYNREENPLDALIEEEIEVTTTTPPGATGSQVVGIKLQNEQGDIHSIRGPQARVEALHAAILMSEQYKIDSNQGIARQDILDRSETIIEESTRELKPTKVKNAEKDSSSLRSEIYGLERSIDELLEIHDQLRTSLIQDDNATKQDINKNPNIKILNRQITNVKSAITRRRNVLLNRNEQVTPTIAEITAVEKKSINDVNNLNRKLQELTEQAITAEEIIVKTEALMEQYQNDPASFQQVSKENDDAKNKLNELEEEIKKLYTLIEYKKQKLRRLENEKQNRPPEPPEQTTPEDTRESKKPITEGENPNTTTVPQEKRTTIASNLGYQRVNSNNYVMNPNTGIFTRIKNAKEVPIPGHSQIEAFSYRDQNGDILVVDSLTGVELGKNKVAKLAGKQAVETLNQGDVIELYKNIIEQRGKVTPAYEPVNIIEEKENFTNSEKRTEKVLTIENGKAKIVENTPAPGPGQRGGMVVMTQAEVEAYDKEQLKDLSEVISEGAQQEIDENKPYGNTQSIKEFVDSAVREGYRQISNSKNPIELKKGVDLSNISYEEGERHLQEIIDLIDKRVRMNQILLDKGKEAYSVDKVIEEVMYKHNTSDILRQAQIGQVAALHRYIKRKMSPTQPTTAAPGSLQKKMTEKLPEIANPTAKKHVPKELVKTRIATQYIGDGSPNSSTDRYRKMYAEEGVANTGNYTVSDIVYVSSNGKRGGRVNPVKDGVLQGEYQNVQKAMDANATIIMDTADHLKRTKNYNIGEIALAEYLTENGYKREGNTGIWKSIEPITEVAPVAPIEQQIKKSEYEVHLEGIYGTGWQIHENVKVEGIKIGDVEGTEYGSAPTFKESIQKDKKVFTITDHTTRDLGGRAGAISISMVFDKNTSNTLEDVKKNLDSLRLAILETRDKYQSSFSNEAQFKLRNLNFKEIATPSVIPAAPVEQQIKKSEYEVHVTGDMLSGWDMQKYSFNVPGIKIRDMRFPRKGSKQEKSKDSKGRTYDVSVQNGKKVFTIVDSSIYRGNRQAGISASMVFNEGTTHTLEDVKGNLTAIMDSLMGVTKGKSSFTVENINTDWGNLDIKEIATPSVIQEESAPKASADPIVKTEMKPVITKDARNNPETFGPWFLDGVSDSNDAKGTAKEITKLREIGKNLDNKNTNWTTGSLRANVDGRPMVSIDIVETGESFIMYKSVSENVWVPIPGFAKNGWFVKSYWDKASPKINKYNIKAFQEISDFFDIPGVGDAMVPIEPTAEVKPKKSFVPNLSLGLANDTKVNETFGIIVNNQGIEQSYNPDMDGKNEIAVDKSILLDPEVLTKEVEFELLPNNWFKEKHGELNDTNWIEVPIYVKIDGVRIGKLESSKVEERKVLVDKLKAGEKVTTMIEEIMTNNFNHSKTAEGKSFFFNPNDVMGNGQALLAFTQIETEDQISREFWTLSEVAQSKNQGDLSQIEQDLSSFNRADAKVNFGQVGIVIRPTNNPQGIARIAMGSTQKLTPTAIKTVIEVLQEKDHDRARQIVANSSMRQRSNSDTFLEFYERQDGTQMVYRSLSLNKLVSINEHELAKALSDKTAKFGFVQTYDPGTGFLEYEPLPQDQIDNTDWDLNIKEDFENFLVGKKYHIDRTLGNTVAPYTSPVDINRKYNNYQEYLFSEEEIGGEREVGFGHNSIFATDLIKIDESFFNNPKITFGKGDLNGNTAKTITNPVKPVRNIKSSEDVELERIAKEMGLSEEDNTIPDCPI